MKRILFSIVMMFCVGMIISAQDIIALRSGSTIDGVNIISVTNDDITYSKDGLTTSIPLNSAEAILYADGRYEEIVIKNNKVGDSLSSTYSESIIEEHTFFQYYDYDSNGRLRLKAAFLDKTYSKECRKIGKKVYYKEYNALYQPAYKKAKKSGLSNMKAMQQALDEILPIVIKASDNAVHECAGDL